MMIRNLVCAPGLAPVPSAYKSQTCLATSTKQQAELPIPGHLDFWAHGWETQNPGDNPKAVVPKTEKQLV